jgi:hypothetical protein
MGDQARLRRRYLDEAASVTDLGREIGCSITAIRKVSGSSC